MPDRRAGSRTAEDWLVEFLDEARRDAAAGIVSTGVTFADAAEEYLRFAEHDRGCKPSTIAATAPSSTPTSCRRSARCASKTSPSAKSSAGAPAPWGRAQRDPFCLTRPRTTSSFYCTRSSGGRSRSTGSGATRWANVDRYRVRASGDIEVFSLEEIWSLVRAASSEIDGTIFLTAAFTGLRRGGLLGLRWRDIDFAATTWVRASYAAGS